MTKTTTVLLALLLGFARQGLAMPPKVGIDDFSHLQVQRVVMSVESMPKELRHALAKIFHQATLSVANPNENLRNEITAGMEPEHYYPHRTKNGELIIVGPVNPSSPDRRLLFGFETTQFFYVYYRQAHPSSAACLVFAKGGSRKRPLLWGGADIRMPSYAQTPEQLRTRILKNRLYDDKNFFW
ncbi:MAG TPA: hypothetical protein VNE84_00270 [Candidatus Limnocylindria bacterium]|nr:hypothetical protein [Candidatus Limnocylindria bacterium]